MLEGMLEEGGGSLGLSLACLYCTAIERVEGKSLTLGLALAISGKIGPQARGMGEIARVGLVVRLYSPRLRPKGERCVGWG